MKKNILGLLALGAISALVSCNSGISEKEQTQKATEILAQYPNTSVEVKDGTAHVMGAFLSEEEKTTALAEVAKVEGVKDVMDMATVSPDGKPTEGGHASMDAQHNQMKIKDALANFPSVNVEIVNDEITLTGNVSAIQEKKIKETVQELKIEKVNFNLVVK